MDQLEDGAEIDSENFRESELIVVATGKPVETSDEQATQTSGRYDSDLLLHSAALGKPDKGESQHSRKPSARFRDPRNTDCVGIQRDGSIDRNGSPVDSGPAVNSDTLIRQNISGKHAVDANRG